MIRGCRIAVNGCFAGEVMGNRELLRRAVENVLRNGVRYSPEHSTMDISVVESSLAVTIAVRDYGPGVPRDGLTRIFDLFFRVEEARDAIWAEDRGWPVHRETSRASASWRHNRGERVPRPARANHHSAPLRPTSH